VGTKVLVAEALRRYDTVGIDCVAMNVNDVICLGAEPLALVNYLALEKARPEVVRKIMIGLRRGAIEAGVAIVAGETAIMSDVVKGFDLAATVIGIVKKNRIISGERTRPGDVILGLRSSGIHSNGLTLARKLLLHARFEPRIARELLRPTRIYAKDILRLFRSGIELHGLAHVTGGAYTKLSRVGKRAKVGFCLDNLPQPQWIFKMIQRRGGISDREMFRTYNMGIGFIVICPRNTAKRVKYLIPDVERIGYVDSSNSVIIGRGESVVEVEKW
jgi:phosphoribosylformylglycinamidine cyclo-ligase